MTIRIGMTLGALALTLAAGSYAVPTAAAATTSAAGRCRLPVYGPGAAYHPHLDRSGFTPNVTNPWFPLTPGRTLLYAGVKDGLPAVDTFTASTRTRVIDGVRTRVVEDRLFLDGRLEERTSDCYAQDRCGNVRYFGEDTAVLDKRGRVIDTSGSFHAGVNGAQPGVYMQARPELTETHRMTWCINYPGHNWVTYVATPVLEPVVTYLGGLAGWHYDGSRPSRPPPTPGSPATPTRATTFAP